MNSSRTCALVLLVACGCSGSQPTEPSAVVEQPEVGVEPVDSTVPMTDSAVADSARPDTRPPMLDSTPPDTMPPPPFDGGAPPGYLPASTPSKASAYGTGGAAVFSRALDKTTNDEVLHGIALDGDDAAVVVGATAIGAPPGPVTRSYLSGENGSEGDVLVAKINAAGTELWSKTFGGAGAQRATAVAVRSGAAVVVGTNAGTLDFGAGPIVAGARDSFVVKLDGSGNVLWSKHLVGSGEQIAHAVAIDASGNVYVAGAFAGAVDFGDATRTAAGDLDAFLWKLDSTGKPVWSLTWGGSGSVINEAYAVAADASGNVFVTGHYAGTTSIAGGPSMTAKGISSDAFLAKISGSGAHVWSKLFFSTWGDFGTSLAVDSTGAVYISGGYQDGFTIESKSLSMLPYPPEGDDPQDMNGFVAKLDGAGTLVYARGFGSGMLAHLFPMGVAIAPSGAATVVGNFGGWFDMGGGYHKMYAGKGAAKYDVFAARIDATGNYVWSKNGGTLVSSLRPAPRVAVDSSGRSWIAGTFRDSLDLGGTKLTTAGDLAGFVTLIGP